MWEFTGVRLDKFSLNIELIENKKSFTMPWQTLPLFTLQLEEAFVLLSTSSKIPPNCQICEFTGFILDKFSPNFPNTRFA